MDDKVAHSLLFTCRLSKEILQFEKYILPTKSEEADRLQMQEMFEDFVAATFPGMKAVPFGSHSTGLCLPGRYSTLADRYAKILTLAIAFCIVTWIWIFVATMGLPKPLSTV
jgi:hypothetical protein